MANAYNDFIEFIGSVQKVEPSFFIAQVSNPLPDLKIIFEGIELDKDDLLIDKWLKDRNEDLFTEYQGHTHGGDTTGDGNHRHQIKFNVQDKLEIGDKVILLKIGSKFIVLNKVVSI